MFLCAGFIRVHDVGTATKPRSFAISKSIKVVVDDDDGDLRGIALSCDRKLLAISNATRHSVDVFAVDTGDRVCRIGSCKKEEGRTHSRLNTPNKLAFLPGSGNIVVADAHVAFGLWEFTCSGDDVRRIGIGTLTSAVSGLDANLSVVVATEWDRVVVFDIFSGRLLRRIQVPAVDASCQRLPICASVRLSHDGRRIVVTDSNTCSVLLFTVEGALICRFINFSTALGMRRLLDACFFEHGIVIVDAASNKLVMFDARSGEIQHSETLEGKTEFDCPCAIAASAGSMCVLRKHGPTGCLFQVDLIL